MEAYTRAGCSLEYTVALSNSRLQQVLSSLISQVAQATPAPPEQIKSKVRQHGLHDVKERELTKALLVLAKEYRTRGQHGRLRGTVLLGVACLGRTFFSDLERKGILLSDDHMPKKFGKFLDDLQSELKTAADADFNHVYERTRSYFAYHQLYTRLAEKTRTMNRLLLTPPRHIIKQLLAVAHIAFLRAYFIYPAFPHLDNILDELGSPEEAGSAVSVIVAIANDQRPLDAFDLGCPSVGDLTSHHIVDLLRHGRVLTERHAFAKCISILGYALDVYPTKAGVVFYLTPPKPQLEYSLRLGYIRSEIESPLKAGIGLGPDMPFLSLRTAARVLVQQMGSRLCSKHVDRFGRRLRLRIPIVPELYKQIMSMPLLEDAAFQRILERDFLVPLSDSDTPIRITDSMTLSEFLKAWRLVEFFCVVDVEAIRPYYQLDREAFLNSLVRVAKEEDFKKLLCGAGLTPGQAEDFFRLVGADVTDRSFYNLQYRPFLRIAPVSAVSSSSPLEMIRLPGVVATTNVLRNVQVANRLRLERLPFVFVEVIAQLLREHFQNVWTNRRIKGGSNSTDVDVVLLEGNRLFLFECKHSIYPSEPHELRDVWEDIEKGVRQLQTAIKILSDPERLHSYVAGWLPGQKREGSGRLEIMYCVISSHRIFSGVDIGGIAIRDYASFSEMVRPSVISMCTTKDEMTVEATRFRVTRELAPTVADMVDYLSVTSRYFQPRGTPENRPMRDTAKPANGIRQDKFVITHGRCWRQ